MPETFNFKQGAIETYLASDLYESDVAEREACFDAMAILFMELGVKLNGRLSQVEVDGILITAVYDGFLISIDHGIPRVALQAHVKCDVCGEMRHSELFNVDEYGHRKGAPVLGKFLLSSHQCEEKPTKRLGLRPE